MSFYMLNETQAQLQQQQDLVFPLPGDLPGTAQSRRIATNSADL